MWVHILYFYGMGYMFFVLSMLLIHFSTEFIIRFVFQLNEIQTLFSVSEKRNSFLGNLQTVQVSTAVAFAHTKYLHIEAIAPQRHKLIIQYTIQQ